MSERYMAGVDQPPGGRRPLPPHAGNAICYSGYRENQGPNIGRYPSYEQVREDLLILAENWSCLRMYDPGPHAETVLEVIASEGLNFTLLLGVDLAAEENNPGCPWGANYTGSRLDANRERNERDVAKAIDLANRYRDIVFATSFGNEASVDWSDHLVPVDRLIGYARELRSQTEQPVTFCENYVPWRNKLRPLVAELDFISVHSYPVWEYKSIDEALAFTRENYESVRSEYPAVPVVITEAGWTTQANGRGIEAHNASEELQSIYYRQLLTWTSRQQILTFVFEAFDEPWKGSDDPLEPEKHWGLFRLDRTPKLVMQRLYAHLCNTEGVTGLV